MYAYLFVCAPHMCRALGGCNRVPEALKLELAAGRGVGVL